MDSPHFLQIRQANWKGRPLDWFGEIVRHLTTLPVIWNITNDKESNILTQLFSNHKFLFKVTWDMTICLQTPSVVTNRIPPATIGRKVNCRTKFVLMSQLVIYRIKRDASEKSCVLLFSHNCSCLWTNVKHCTATLYCDLHCMSHAFAVTQLLKLIKSDNVWLNYEN